MHIHENENRTKSAGFGPNPDHNVTHGLRLRNVKIPILRNLAPLFERTGGFPEAALGLLRSRIAKLGGGGGGDEMKERLRCSNKKRFGAIG
jgi:hypothetical protein